MTADIKPPIDSAHDVRRLDEVSVMARWFGFVSAVGFVALSVVYAIPLTVGLLTLPSKGAPIANPWFSMMEVLILLSAPFMVTLSVCIHLLAPAARRPFSLASLVFMGMAAVVTCSVHLTILTLSHQPAIANLPWTPSLLSFTWPSVPYALDILAWDFFFPLSVLLAAIVFGGSRLTNAIRVLLFVSGLVSLVGLFGPALGNMDIRSIGIVGYAVVFPIAVVLMARLFRAPAASLET
jgi:hypothetical protein